MNFYHKGTISLLRRFYSSKLATILSSVFVSWCMFGVLCRLAWRSASLKPLLTIPASTILPSNMNVKTAVIVLGGGLTETGAVLPHTQLRLKRAVEWYHKLGSKAIFITLSGGTPHKPNPRDSRGFQIWESTAAARGLIEMGVPADQIMEESFSLDTVGNAYFLRAVHTDPASIRKLVVITNDWHMDRTRAIFSYVFSLPRTVSCGQGSSNGKRNSGNNPTIDWTGWNAMDSLLHFLTFNCFRNNHIVSSSTTSYEGSAVNIDHCHSSYQIEFDTVDSGIADSVALQTRIQREKSSERHFLTTTRHLFHNFEEMHSWLFSQHAAYSVSRFTKENTPALTADVLKSY